MGSISRQLLAVGAVIGALCVAGAARADVFSPGPLSKGHQKLEGLANCTKCHIAGGQLSQERCLDCHVEIKTRVSAKTGFHGKLAPKELACNQCHHEHEGRDTVLIDWGPKGQPGFDHAKTGFTLTGAHADLKCEQCHLPALIVDPAVRTLRATHQGRETFLGAAATCAGCHFDEHRAQLSTACQDCHTSKAWKPASGFDHARAAFTLAGKHADVACLKCHVKVLDTVTAKAVFPKPAHEVFQRFKPVAHEGCVDCHKDPHEGRFGQSCVDCHTVDGWLQLKAKATEGIGARAFHQKTRYPLQGAHVDVACKSCHGPFPGQRAVFKNMNFEQCADCHVDAHLGQVPLRPKAGCDQCHSVQAFLPVRYELASHKGFPLEGGHAAAACSSCHKQDDKLAAKATPVRAWVERRGRHDKVSLTQFHPPFTQGRCDACHADVHQGQFAARVKAKGCADCHSIESFAKVRFDHQRETHFALEGKHAGVACASCHLADAKGVVRFAGLQLACASCHRDPHLGQFAASAKVPTDCTHCHGTAGWKPSSFQHAPPFTKFILEGAHEKVACEGCHREVTVTASVTARRYRGVPSACEACHVDVHRGAFRELAQ